MLAWERIKETDLTLGSLNYKSMKIWINTSSQFLQRNFIKSIEFLGRFSVKVSIKHRILTAPVVLVLNKRANAPRYGTSSSRGVGSKEGEASETRPRTVETSQRGSFEVVVIKRLITSILLAIPGDPERGAKKSLLRRQVRGQDYQEARLARAMNNLAYRKRTPYSSWRHSRYRLPYIRANLSKHGHDRTRPFFPRINVTNRETRLVSTVKSGLMRWNPNHGEARKNYDEITDWKKRYFLEIPRFFTAPIKMCTRRNWFCFRR